MTKQRKRGMTAYEGVPESAADAAAADAGEFSTHRLNPFNLLLLTDLRVE